MTAFGRKLYAIGNDAAAARKAGINIVRVLFAVYLISGTSLFGGCGQLVPGTMLGAILIQTVENGIVNADPYLYPIIMGAIIFLAVLIGSLRHAQLLKMGRSKIRAEEVSA
ncbi:MAG TPA: hypothetical protein VM866_03685 [Pyrinomonadaceae bacterium]|jgi:ribose transport system permease protein|nr:hypothetical protein [Pyrinomonadaceae bacterium]